MSRLAVLLLMAMAPLVAHDISGSWVFDVQTDAGSGSPSFVFKQDGEKLTGTYTGMFGKAELTGTVKGDQIDFEFAFNYQGQSGKARYTGTIESATKMKGEVAFPELGKGTWSGTRK